MTSDLTISISPKVPLGNLFRMLEYAYRLDALEYLGMTDSDSLDEFYERLAAVLAKRVLDRARKGLYSSYVAQSDDLPYLRGRIDLRERLRHPLSANLACRYEEHTADLEENQILAWTLGVIARSGCCSERVLPTVRKAYHLLQGAVSQVAFRPAACLGRLYNRLNDDYEPLHALCRFFLEHSGPTHERGDRSMVPFAIKMDRLFELFVAEWLQAHLKASLELRYQECVRVGHRDEFSLRMDMVVCNRHNGRPLVVLDAKYKSPERPDQADINQAVTYAETLGSYDAMLVYPIALPIPLDAVYGRNRVRSIAFRLDGDLEQNGEQFLRNCQLESLASPEVEAAGTLGPRA